MTGAPLTQRVERLLGPCTPEVVRRDRWWLPSAAAGLVVVALAGVVLSYSWYRALRSYKDLNEGRFKVIHAIEDLLPVRPYAAEWMALGRGDDKKLYLPFSRVERKVPWAFLVLFALAALGAVLDRLV